MDKLYLRQFTDEDVTIFKNWIYETHVAKWYLEPLDWIDEIQNRNGEFSFVHHFIAVLDEIPMGFCQYYEYCYGGESWHGSIAVEGTYSIDYLIGNPDYIGKGYGTLIVKRLIDEIWSLDNAKRIIVQPDVKNAASCNTLLSCGFVYDEKNGLYILQR